LETDLVLDISSNATEVGEIHPAVTVNVLDVTSPGFYLAPADAFIPYSDHE
jgi:hypothetical protein